MAPSSGSKGQRQGPNGLIARPDMSAAAADALSAKLSRKRTKTGCLTCRRRRIKCGEERPICRNCVKSKRQCEGYAQRVVFKPSFDFREVENGAAHITFHAGPMQGQGNQYEQGFPVDAVDAAHIHYQHVPFDRLPEGYSRPVQSHHEYQGNFHAPVQAFHPGPVQPLPPGIIPEAVYPQQVLNGGVPPPYQPLTNQNIGSTYPVHPASTFGPPIGLTSQPQEPPTPAFALPVSQPSYHEQFYPQNDQTWQHSSPATTVTIDRVSPASARSSNTIPWNGASVPEDVFPTWPSAGYAPQSQSSHQVEYQNQPSMTHQLQQPFHYRNVQVDVPNHKIHELYDHAQQQIEHVVTPTQFLAQAAVETHDDDYYDVQSDEEMEMETSLLSSIDLERQRTLHTILQINNISIQDLQTRRYDTFIYDGILTRYKAEEVASPLRNPATARVFAHFISVTGPSLSIYERHPRNTSVLFTEGQIPFSQQGLWTYTMPMAALHHQGLLHAMLALASLHIARLQNASLTPSMQHYAWSLKRIHSCVSNAKKRYKLTTIAATMLLGFYEIMTADHMKWNMHLTGSKQLFLETDFVTMVRQFRRLKTDRMSRAENGHIKVESPQISARDEVLDQIYDVDERVVSEIAGKEVRYDDYGQIVTQRSKVPPALDLSRFEILRDLYWWYLKQDAYQSIVSGNPLLLDYSRWTNCPPRAPLGKSDAVYGSFDHLILLLGRIADFASRDRVRKLRQMEANGGNWLPPPGMNIPMPPQQGAPPTPVSASNFQPMGGSQFPQPQTPGPPPAMPQFYGMAPPPRENVRMPASYAPSSSIPTPDTPSPRECSDLNTAREAALQEFGRIRAALLTFENSLGEGFQPLSPDYQPPMDTPFGHALFYRSYDIGCLWAMYHMAVIIAIRSHPDMHPAAHAAAAILANQTQYHANVIGQIAAGIVPGPPDQPLNPTLGGSLCESCMPSFFAAVQYHDAEQRHHTVTRIYSIAQRTGWGSAELIAHGCETAWVKAAQIGRGPPYTRMLRQRLGQTEDPRKNGSWEKDDPSSTPDQSNEADRRFVTVKPNARLNWAIGIMGTEADESLAAMN